MLDVMSADKKKFIPTSGYNVVGVDDFELPGEQLYLVGHFTSQSMADASLAKFKKANPGEIAYVYGPETK